GTSNTRRRSRCCSMDGRIYLRRTRPERAEILRETPPWRPRPLPPPPSAPPHLHSAMRQSSMTSRCALQVAQVVKHGALVLPADSAEVAEEAAAACHHLGEADLLQGADREDQCNHLSMRETEIKDYEDTEATTVLELSPSRARCTSALLYFFQQAHEAASQSALLLWLLLLSLQLDSWRWVR
ncbi:mCG146243, partial [Mus musculus]